MYIVVHSTQRMAGFGVDYDSVLSGDINGLLLELYKYNIRCIFTSSDYRGIRGILGNCNHRIAGTVDEDSSSVYDGTKRASKLGNGMAMYKDVTNDTSSKFKIYEILSENIAVEDELEILI